MYTFEAQELAETTYENVGHRKGSIEQHCFAKKKTPTGISHSPVVQIF
jgi:hypothetical protein